VTNDTHAMVIHEFARIFAEPIESPCGKETGRGQAKKNPAQWPGFMRLGEDA